MMIYQVHEHSGVYEDYIDIIRGTFVHRDNAENFTKECIKEEVAIREQYKKCWDCEYNKDCFEPGEEEPCKNEIIWHDDCTYSIREEEILDWEDEYDK